MIEGKQRNLKDSHAQNLMKKHHPKTEWTLADDGETKHRYSWKVTRDGEKVIVITREEIEKDGVLSERLKERHLIPNRIGPCIGERCLVRCSYCQE